jgi:hypothetical protein
MLLGHKVSISRWNEAGGLPEGRIQADAITADLRTQDNRLSFWNCGEDDVNDAMLADAVLAVASSMDRASKVDLVWVLRESLEKYGYLLDFNDGQTPVKGLKGRHVDVCGLDYEGLGRVARQVSVAVKAGQWRRYSQKKVLELLAAAVKQDRLDVEELKEKLRESVRTKL